jgi:hypothetical protein
MIRARSWVEVVSLDTRSRRDTTLFRNGGRRWSGCNKRSWSLGWSVGGRWIDGLVMMGDVLVWIGTCEGGKRNVSVERE